ncbi:MAG: sugar dehydrogenase [Micromonosporaceae bacterium]|nr:sugar dehydrogenase [Micromonosporaceae bacterium]
MRRTAVRVMAGTLCLAGVIGVVTAGCSQPPAGDGDSDLDGATAPVPTPAPDRRVRLTEVATAQAPSAGVAGPDGTVWIAERPGRVRVLDQEGLGAPVLDITGETTTDGERGLLGIAFDEDFAHLYLSFTDRNGHTTIDELAVAGGQPQPQTRRTLLTQEQPFANHNGGDLVFGPDGMLYIGLGDGGSGGDPLGSGQDLGSLLGTLLRIDPTGNQNGGYAVPPDNPFVGQPGARAEIWAYGLRNPWRFSFDAGTGDLWIADVGQSAREEIDLAAAGTGAGANYGWSRMEGTQPFSGDEPDNHVPPVFEYDNEPGRCSVTGGYVYRGEAIPGLAGNYLFSDFCEGNIQALEVRDGEVTGETNLGVNGGSVVGFAQGPDRELYVLDLAGPIYRIDPA